jgi:hypothetical protein
VSSYIVVKWKVDLVADESVGDPASSGAIATTAQDDVEKR